MFLYEKKIVYLSLFQDGNKISSVGFVKILRERNACRLELHIKKNTQVYNGNYALTLVLKNREVPWGTVAIRKEEDSVEKSLPMRGDMLCFEGECVRVQDVCGILIRLGEECWISGYLKESDLLRETKRDSERESTGIWEAGKDYGRERPRRTERNPEEKAERPRRTGRNSEEKAERPRRTGRNPEEETGRIWRTERNSEGKADRARRTGKSLEKEYAGDRSAVKRNLYAAGISLPEDKWTQLQRSYKTVHPFGDDRVFVSVELRDFHILKSSYQKLANNSFLLHGFYNYRHLILGPDRELGGGNGFCFYLGVPGTFFEREKMVAVMFGFEGFECSGAVEVGKFGYYMRRVEIE